MKKKILIPLFAILILLALIVSYQAFFKSPSAKKASNKNVPLYIAKLREDLENAHFIIADICKDSSSVSKKIIDLSQSSEKRRFDFLCEDEQLEKELKENFAKNKDYNYFLECAKNYAIEIQFLIDDLKNNYPEDYKNINFGQENIMLKYLKHPKAAYFKVQCENKSEELYWETIVSSKKVEDLKFCIGIMEDCINEKTDIKECPKEYLKYHKECASELDKLRGAH